MGFTQREARTIVRKAVKRVPEGEAIRHLNIMPMMDMMTILLVAFVAQNATTTLETASTTKGLIMPKIDSDEQLTELATTIVITREEIFVDTEKVPGASISSNGDVDCYVKEDHSCLGVKITPLTSGLAKYRKDKVKKLEEERTTLAPIPENQARLVAIDKEIRDPELLIIADRLTQYRLLIEVMFSAKQKDASGYPNYKHFRLVMQQSHPPTIDK
jgi:biopolymer transport protein ExbD